ncbi:MAG: hypothetical protein ACK2UK_18375 [Candidatus Promineifilaceae bacterium]|jgi:NAD(P)-dependent dehydrogenase (short-subunit alcohol dehydrogenase family)
MNGTQAAANSVAGSNGRFVNHDYPLAGKVAVLFGENTPAVRRMIPALAGRGSDIAVVCSRASFAPLAPLGAGVQSAGRRLVFVDKALQETAGGDQTIAAVLSKLGRIDVLIDLSVQGASGRSSGGHSLIN